MDIIIHNHCTVDIAELKNLLLLIIKNQKKEMADLTALQTSVANTTTVEQSAIVLLQGLKAQLDAAGTDPAALKALSDSLDSGANDLAAAVSANTPVANP